MRIVLDTNVLVSAVLNPHGRPADVLNLLLNGRIIACLDDRILAEYRGVLSRPAFNFDPNDVAALVLFFEKESTRVNPPALSLVLDDPDDLMLYEVLAAADADYLVTGNVHHFRAARDRRVVTPKEFIERFFEIPGEGERNAPRG